MKKRFSRRHNSLSAAYPWAGPAVLALMLVAVVIAGIRFLAPNALVSVSTPLWTGGNALTAGVGNVGAFFTDRGKLQEERDSLLAENAALRAMSATSEARAADFARLLGDRIEPARGVVAGVLARPPVSPYDVLIVDQGSESGMAPGSVVEGPGGMPLGLIESVTASSARVLLFSTPGQETESWIGESRIPVTLIGEGAGSMSAEVAREAGIITGDLVYAAGPGARAVGIVTAVGNDPSSPRSRADIRPLQNPFSLTWVTVLP
ncbi:MAG: rod shape-determining protein MreC [Patescibacteria group bacterium]